MNPNPMPFVIEKLNGISMITSAAGSPIARSWKSIPATQPVRPPEATPEPDSMYVVADDVDDAPPAIAAIARPSPSGRPAEARTY